MFLDPLERYWLSPCCENPGHLVNYREQSYLPSLNNSISALRDCIRDSLYTRRVSNYRVLCPNKMMGLGPRTGGISDSEAKEHTDRCGGDPVHPSAAAYRRWRKTSPRTFLMRKNAIPIWLRQHSSRTISGHKLTSASRGMIG